MSNYTDEELKAMAGVVMRHISKNEDVGLEVVMTMSARMGMHPQAVVNEIQRLANLP